MTPARPLHAVVLAAGLSTRLGGNQKALYAIRGVSLLERTIRQLAASPVSTISVVTGHGAEEVERAAGELGSALGTPTVGTLHNDEFRGLNNFYSVELACERAPEGDLVVVNGDVICTPAALAVLLEPAGSAADAFLAVADEQFDDEAMKVATSAGRVLRLGKNLPREQFGGEFIGLSRLTPSARAWYAGVSRWSRARGLTNLYYEDVYDCLCGGLAVAECAVAPGDWAEVDAPADVARAEAVAALID